MLGKNRQNMKSTCPTETNAKVIGQSDHVPLHIKARNRVQVCFFYTNLLVFAIRNAHVGSINQRPVGSHSGGI